MNEEKLVFFERLLKERPQDTNLMYWVAYYNEEIAKEMRERGEDWRGYRETAKSWYKKASIGGDEEATKALSKILSEETHYTKELNLNNGEDEKKWKKWAFIFLLWMVAIVLLIITNLKNEYKNTNEAVMQQSVVEEKVPDEKVGIVGDEKKGNEYVNNKKADSNDEVKATDSIEVVLLRSAVYQFVLDENRLPFELEELTASFPNNYLSEIPRTGIQSENKVVTEYDGTGGWVYNPRIISKIEMEEETELLKIIEEVVSPNFAHKCNKLCGFEPLEILISKQDKKLWVLFGEEVIAAVEVGVGKGNRTPVGEFEISKKVAFPNHQAGYETNPYGTRAMELSGMKYAIHGTYVEESIGEEMSMGCVRVKNVIMERLYSIVPLGTDVTITEEIPPEMGEVLMSEDKSEDNSNENIEKDEIKGIGAFDGDMDMFKSEMDLEKIYGWLG